MIYYYPYTDTNTFTPEYLIRKRNEFLHRYVPGPTKGSYMTTESQYPVIFREMAKDGDYLVELRGLWKLEKAFMGGPFISYTFVDEQHNRVVTIMGYVYNPSQDKRDLVRQVEAILYTFQYPEQAKEQASSGKLKE